MMNMMFKECNTLSETIECMMSEADMVVWKETRAVESKKVYHPPVERTNAYGPA